MLHAKSSLHSPLPAAATIKLDTASFELLTSPTRDWSASIQLTALDPRRRCNPCKEFSPSWNAVAKAWSKTSKQHRDTHFFATLDFDDGQAVFQQLGLASAPVVYAYPAAEGSRSTGKTAPSTYDFSHGFEAGPLAQHLSRHTPIPIPYTAPFDWARWTTTAAGVLANRWTWAVVSILTSLVMTSGYMFTRIRNSPFMGGDGSWIAGGFQNQYGQEVQVISLVYGTLGFAFIMLTLVIPYQSSSQRQRFQVYLWTAVIAMVYSILVVLFKAKNRGYPFRLLL
ncbi:oligosaccharyl transferase subunit OST3/OST6 family [Roridomyces roridus]|uniref:Oligosaccharyl transferase subunit OST3/OST6 family n=1 Tax=Roridomyces roridus TaxID=1738132 RepID=A0AAD7BWH1_9AGAR|nr:oligosaccharyl transferase subunit OST3/OST6 family [Roridomyces roridus]